MLRIPSAVRRVWSLVRSEASAGLVEAVVGGKLAKNVMADEGRRMALRPKRRKMVAMVTAA